MELRRLWNSRVAEVLISGWDRARHPAQREGCTSSAVMEFMQSGCYARSVARREFLVDVNHVAFFNPAETFRVSHPCGDRNVGLTLRVSSDVLVGLLNDVDPECGNRSNQLFKLPWGTSSPRCHLLQNRLVAILSNHNSPEPVLIEEILLSVIREAIGVLHRQRGVVPGQRSHPRDTSGLQRVETVRRYIASHWVERLSLTGLAGLAGCSTWHLATIFHNWVGLSVYRYIKRLRLRQALRCISQGHTDLTQLALDCGFSSHSHFSSAFRQEFGTTPSAIRRLPARRTNEKCHSLPRRRHVC